jgi:hypothetical protein
MAYRSALTLVYSQSLEPRFLRETGVLRNIAVLALVRYKNPTPNPLPARKEGAMMYLM